MAPGGMSRNGRFITFEGGEGGGKSTQVERLASALAGIGIAAVTTREPGGTQGAEAIRRLLVKGAVQRWSPLTEALLHLAARHDHVVRRIEPELAAGRWVISDRFSDSTRVYQGIAGGVGLAVVDELHRAVLGDLQPDLTFILDLPVEQGLARRRGPPGEDRYERMGSAFHERVRQGFLLLARQEPERCVVLDATAPIEGVARSVCAALSTRFALDFGALAPPELRHGDHNP